MYDKVILLVLDSLGIGELPDAYKYGDQGSNTLAHCAEAVNGINLPNMAGIGLGWLGDFKGVRKVEKPSGSYGKMSELSAGKDTTTGHWEMAGIITEKPFPVYPGGFPREVINAFERVTGLGVLGNKAASGTEIIKELGEEHIKTGKPIVYTSADSVFQIAAHEDIIPVDRLYDLCRAAREILNGDHAVGRVIARPFAGKPGNFSRTSRRHDFSLKPPQANILRMISGAGYPVNAVGKINDIFAGVGITKSYPTKDNADGIDKTVELIKNTGSGLIFTNLVEFDMLYGHRNDPVGYAAALEAFDVRLPDITGAMNENDMIIITADHGCDPVTTSTDHSREYVPLLVYGRQVLSGIDLGVRRTFADIAATLAEIYKLPFNTGDSFLSEIINKK